MNTQSLNILYEDNHILVCIKPAGTATQSRSIKSPDMVSILKIHITENITRKNIITESVTKKPYLAVVHRLDQPVQGIMVFAKTSFAARELSRQLQAGGFGKYYRALILGKPPKASGTLENYIKKDEKNNISYICKKETPGAKTARLSYETVPGDKQYFAGDFIPKQGMTDFRTDWGVTELDIRLHTGRHHQIRVQLANIGCPIIGDTKYNHGNTEKNNWQELKLCSYRLDFQHPKTKKAMSFSLI